jgi:lysozyme
MQVTFGMDVSHHQGGSLNFVALRKAGAEFVFLKSTESSGFVDSQFVTNLSRARSAGMLVAAYHYVRSGVTAAAQVANVVRTVPKDVPVIPDVEANSGSVALVREFVDKLRAAGYRVPLTYLPRWYWKQIGSPSLAGLPPLWSSRYPDNVVRSLVDAYSKAPSSYWDGYGGLGVSVLQFTSSADIAGVHPLDANAFPGTRDGIATMLGYQTQENDMQPTDVVIDPATSQPAKDINGNPYNYGQAWFYTNQAVWLLKAELDEVKDAIAKIQVGGVDIEALATKLSPLVSKAVNDELARRQAE